MLAEERFAMILDLLAQKRSATVLELCDALDASESTIRRDLTQLDRQGLLKKVHGGATLVGRTVLADEPPITGPETLAALQHYNFTKAFMGANGVSPAEGFTTPDPEEASIKTAALQRARERWFLVDNTKFDMVYSAVIGDIGCGAILTNHCPDPRYAQLTFVKECSV